MPPYRVQAPKPPDTSLEPEAPDDTLESGTEYDNFVLTSANFAGQIASKVRLTEAQLKKVNLGNSKLPDMRLNDVTFTNCDLAAAQWEKMYARRVVIDDSRLLGWQAIEADVRDVVFRKCQMSNALFRFAKLQNVLFEDCVLREADFHNADLSKVRFRRCEMQGADLTKATLTGTDLRTCELEGILLSPDTLAGLIIEPSQAVDIVRTVGVVVDWENDEG